MGAVASLEVVESGAALRTYHVALQRVPETFGDAQNANHDEEHAKLFQAPLQNAIRAEHAALYQDIPWSHLAGVQYDKCSLSTGVSFLSLLNHGVRQGKRRVFTYVLLDTGLFFSETGAQKAKDLLSKHAVHANGPPAVRMAGTFRICEEKNTSVLVADNDSGTYRPSPEHLPLLQQVLELNFPGLRVDVLNVLSPQPEETLDFVGPNESKENSDAVYAGQWKWRSSSQ